MGWSSGTPLMEKIIGFTRAVVDDPATRQRLYEGFIPAFEAADWDNIDEVFGMDSAFDAAARKLYPEYFE